MCTSRFSLVGFVLLAILAVFSSGCSSSVKGPGAGKETGTVSGTVKQKGQPVPANTTVTFLDSDGVTASGITDSTGHYSLSFNKSSSIPVGKYKVSFTPFNPGDAASADPSQFFTPDGKTKPPQVEKSSLASKYSNPATSGVAREVKTGNNTIDIELPD